MFTVTLTWGDILIEAGIAIGVALLGRYAGRWRVSYRRNRIEAWSKNLNQYEADFADGRLFMARIVYHATAAMASFVFAAAFIVLALMTEIIYYANCAFLNNCKDLPITAPLNQVRWTSGACYAGALIFLFLSGVWGGRLRDEIAPEKYQSRIKESIAQARLRDRAE